MSVNFYSKIKFFDSWKLLIIEKLMFWDKKGAVKYLKFDIDKLNICDFEFRNLWIKRN